MKKYGKWLLFGSILVLLLWIVPIVQVFQMRRHAITHAAATASRFLTALNTHDYVAAHALFASSQQQTLSLTALQDAENQIEKKHGKASGQFTLNEYHPSLALTTIVLFYENDYQRQSEPVRITMILTQIGCQVQEYRYDTSPA